MTGGHIDLDMKIPINYTHKDYNVYTKNAKLLIDLAIKENNKGNVFPIWGGC